LSFLFTSKQINLQYKIHDIYKAVVFNVALNRAYIFSVFITNVQAIDYSRSWFKS